MFGTMILLGIAAVLLMIGFGLFLAKTSTDRKRVAKARQSFQLRREWLEADFLATASTSGKPRGLSWLDCVFEDEVTFARDRFSNQLRALVGVTVSFEAIEGGGMEHVEAVSNLRSATAVFHFVDEAWTTDGRVVFNLDPAETIDHFRELESV